MDAGDTKRNTDAKNRGLTVVELIVVVSILSLLAGFLWGGLSSYRNEQSLATSVETVLAALSEARTKAVSSERNLQYGVYLKKDRVVVFQGTVYTEPNSLNQEYFLEGPIAIASTSLAASTSTILFSKISGAADNDGTITLAFRSNNARTAVIRVHKTGDVSVQ